VSTDPMVERMQPQNPIDHVVIIVKENHTFDNYFGSFPGTNGALLSYPWRPYD
jgi:phospholipase C